MNALRSFARLALPLVVTGCSLTGPGEERDPLVRLEEGRAKWGANGPGEYELAMRRSCGECLPEGALAVVVSVSAGGTTVSLAQNGERIETRPGLYPDVEGLFDLIETYILAGAEVEAEYDGDLGFPRSVSIDPSPDAVDDEFGYVVDDLAAGRLAALRADLRVRRERWAAQRILDYQLTLSRSCFCSPEGAGLAVITVLEGEPVEWQYFLSGDPIAPEWRAVFPTVEGLFDFLQDAIDRGAESIEVRYDEDLGLPTTIRIDYRLAAVDEEIAYEVEKLVDLGGGPGPTPARGGP
jgi:hypothetical protein